MSRCDCCADRKTTCADCGRVYRMLVNANLKKAEAKLRLIVNDTSDDMVGDACDALEELHKAMGTFQ